MVTKKGEPTLGSIGVPGHPFHPAGNRSFGNVKTEHKKFAMDAGSSPSRVLRHRLGPTFPVSALPRPEGRNGVILGGIATGILLLHETTCKVLRCGRKVRNPGAREFSPTRLYEASGRRARGSGGGSGNDSRAFSRRIDATAQLLSCRSVRSDCG